MDFINIMVDFRNARQQKSISRIETQERVVADYELRALATALEVDVNWLLNFNNKLKNPS